MTKTKIVSLNSLLSSSDHRPTDKYCWVSYMYCIRYTVLCYSNIINMSKRIFIARFCDTNVRNVCELNNSYKFADGKVSRDYSELMRLLVFSFATWGKISVPCTSIQYWYASSKPEIYPKMLKFKNAIWVDVRMLVNAMPLRCFFHFFVSV